MRHEVAEERRQEREELQKLAREAYEAAEKLDLAMTVSFYFRDHNVAHRTFVASELLKQVRDVFEGAATPG